MKNFLGASHLPILTKIMDLSKEGPVLELGMGYYSTAYLYWKCIEQRRELISFESDKKWFKKLFSDKHSSLIMENPINPEVVDMGAECNKFSAFRVVDWDKLELGDIHWSVALIDHRPALQRHKDAIKLKNNADFIVLHDTEESIDRFYAYRRVWKHFKYVYHYEKVGKPRTSVVSNFVDLSILE